MSFKSLLAILLSALLTASAVSCGSASSAENENNTPGVQTEATGEDTPTLESVTESYSDRDYGGYTFRVGVRDEPDWETMDVIAQELTGEAINDAVFSRNTAMEETMNIRITEIRHERPATNLTQSVTAGTDDYDTVTDGLVIAAPLVVQNMLLNYRDIASIHPEQVYWDPQIYDDCSIAGKTYMMTGDISVMDNMGTWCMLFNKDLVKDHGLENPYELVNEGKWTLDKMDEMASAVLHDADGDGQWTEADTYGFLTESYNNIALWSCAGLKVLTKDSDDLPVFSYDSEQALDVLTKVLELQYADHTNMGSGSTIIYGGLNTSDPSREKQFANGKGLFYYAGMINITQFREYDTDFGVLPAPKYNEQQAQYWSNYSYGNFTIYVIPATCPDAEKIGDIMDAMANLSAYTLTPAYYEKTLIGKSTRDEESRPMIELILATRNFDLGIFYNTGNVAASIITMTDPGSISSTFASIEASADQALEEFLEDLEKLY